MKNRFRSLSVVLAGLCPFQAACVSWATIPDTEITAHEEVQVVALDGSTTLLLRPTIEADTIRGTRIETGARACRGEPAAIPLDRVREIRADKVDTRKTIAAGASGLLFVAGVMGLILATSEDVTS